VCVSASASASGSYTFGGGHCAVLIFSSQFSSECVVLYGKFYLGFSHSSLRGCSVATTGSLSYFWGGVQRNEVVRMKCLVQSVVSSAELCLHLTFCRFVQEIRV
jgi:hypothetical protein